MDAATKEAAEGAAPASGDDTSASVCTATSPTVWNTWSPAEPGKTSRSGDAIAARCETSRRRLRGCGLAGASAARAPVARRGGPSGSGSAEADGVLTWRKRARDARHFLLARVASLQAVAHSGSGDAASPPWSACGRACALRRTREPGCLYETAHALRRRTFGELLKHRHPVARAAAVLLQHAVELSRQQSASAAAESHQTLHPLP